MVAEWVTHLTTLGVSIGRASRIIGAKWRLSAQLLDVRSQRNAFYKAQSPQAEPVRPSCKNMPMNAILANLPLPSSADNMLVFSLGSLEVRTLKPKPNSFPYARSGMHCLEYRPAAIAGLLHEH